MDALAEFVIRRYRGLLVGVGLPTLAIIAFIPTLDFNDQWVEYFDERIEFRVDSDQAMNHFGLYPIEYSVPANGPGGISEPEYLANLERLTGLDLNDRINVDKSATRVTATIEQATSAETKAFFNDVDAWMQDNLPPYMHAKPTSAAVMFTYISERNMQNMVVGTILAIAAIAVIMMFALRSVRILVTFGAWALLVGEVGFSVATVASISLGIIVDDTVHWLSKYVRARDERNLSVEDSIRYAFHNVGTAIIVNTIILAAGFFVMTTSAFKMNVDLGLMTILSIIGALILDFLLLPALLLYGRNKEQPDIAGDTKLLPSTA
jgi:predicted RND superfamily exporter protein